MMNPSKQPGEKQSQPKVQLLTTHELRPASGKPSDGTRKSELIRVGE